MCLLVGIGANMANPYFENGHLKRDGKLNYQMQDFKHGERETIAKEPASKVMSKEVSKVNENFRKEVHVYYHRAK